MKKNHIIKKYILLKNQIINYISINKGWDRQKWEITSHILVFEIFLIGIKLFEIYLSFLLIFFMGLFVYFWFKSIFNLIKEKNKKEYDDIMKLVKIPKGKWDY